MRLPSRTFGLLRQRENDSFRYDSYGNLLSDLGDVPVLPRSGKDRPGLLLSTPSLAAVFSSRVPVRKNFAALVRRLQTQSICQRKINPCFTSKMGKTLELGGYRAVRFEMSVRNALAV